MLWDGVVVSLYDCDFRIAWVSKVIHPLTEDDVIGRRAWEFMDQSSAAKFQAAAMRMQVEKAHQFVEINGRTGFWVGCIYPSDFDDVRCVGIYCKLPQSLHVLTPREREVCLLLADGKSSGEISNELGIARSTVDNHRAHIASKLHICPQGLVAWCGRNEMALKFLTKGVGAVMVSS